ncbi:hypothetical protein A2960_02610 [Candidatus Gottesmanbacteria bacterium RIFCSPLOWO2_01_FULL_39_12b]|uniref:Uncharacterized protein n=1 Tax=Candidatus Gottesmanbacteria bacterium RIFCSPLOWO2_01_FULL_39_12b TaxID=1798388 RepID=A0A1F6AR91_9BACT|nr:MAG: hypothetical protein A2960_02610 [Candidatus Gottesmanbacteria bacterium RIFCSPLOWO2_01_FULL_39_12b]
MLKTIRNLIIAISFLILSFGIGYKLGAKNLDFESFKNTNFIGKTSSVPKSVDFTLFWDVWDRLSRTYIDKKNLDP